MRRNILWIDSESLADVVTDYADLRKFLQYVVTNRNNNNPDNRNNNNGFRLVVSQFRSGLEERKLSNLEIQN
ncbi:MAG: hypothetical protein H0S84_10820 [Bacteroidales bacterium]|nr:hypothetical protein [Bacteroidales bacterium]